ncbi:hypothetical protein [Priestia megaterium]
MQTAGSFIIQSMPNTEEESIRFIMLCI